MWVFKRRKREKEVYVHMCRLERHGATCENCKKLKICKKSGEVCPSYAGVTETGTEFF